MRPNVPFWKRLVLLPFQPGLWADARQWTTWEVLGPLLTLSLVLSLGLGLYRGVDLRRVLLRAAADYDKSFDPVVIERGEVRVEGPRLPRFEEGDSSFLVDPEETVPESALKGRQRIVVRKKWVVDTRTGVRRETQVAQVTELLGVERITVDSASIRAWTQTWGTALMVGLTAFIAAFGVLGQALTCLLYALVAGWALNAMRGKALGLKWDATFRVALATLALKPVAGTALSLLGTGVGGCMGALVWPAVALGLGYFALTRVPAPVPPLTPPT